MKLLSDYLTRIFPDGTASAAFICKGEGDSHTSNCYPARLQKGQTNRILVYLGSFNPPHLGHLELLRHGFLRSGKDLNLIAAVIVFMNHDHVASKCKGLHPGLVFSKEERSLLWREHPGLPPWAWVFDREWEEFVWFQGELIYMTERDGYEVEFVKLWGPDCRPRSNWNGRGKSGFDCREIIICDVARESQILSKDGIDPYDGFTEWKQVGLTRVMAAGKEIEYDAKQSAELAFQKQYNLDPVANLWRVAETPEMRHRKLQQFSSLFDCHRIGNKDAKVRFVRSWQDEPRSCATCLQKSDLIQVRDVSSTVRCKSAEEEIINAQIEDEEIEDEEIEDEVIEDEEIINAQLEEEPMSEIFESPDTPFATAHIFPPFFEFPFLGVPTLIHLTPHLRPHIPTRPPSPPPCTACVARASIVPFRDISSTKVRQLMETTPMDRLAEVLERMALSPMLLMKLWRIHREKDTRERPRKRHKS